LTAKTKKPADSITYANFSGFIKDKYFIFSVNIKAIKISINTETKK
jgi:hypothetical protein